MKPGSPFDFVTRYPKPFIPVSSVHLKISAQTTPRTPWDATRWRRVRIVRRLASGRIEVYFDDMDTPAMIATDKTFAGGGVGLGSFDDEAEGDGFELRGLAAKPE